MGDPVRWGDARSTGPRSLRRLIRAARAETPDAERMSHIAERLGLAPGAAARSAGAAAKGAASAAAKGTASAAAWAGSAKLGAVLALVVSAGAAAGAWASRGEPARAAAALPAAAVQEAAPSGEGGDPAPAQLVAPEAPRSTPSPVVPDRAASAPSWTPRAPASTRAAAAHPAASPVPDSPAAAASSAASASPRAAPEPSVETEASLLDQARRALHVDPAQALALAERHERRYPSGALAVDREAVAIEALVQLGRLDEARARGAHFLRSYPGSVHQRHLEALLGIDTGVDNP